MSTPNQRGINTGNTGDDPDMFLKISPDEELEGEYNYADARERLISVAKAGGFSDHFIGGGKKPLESKE